MNIRHAVAAEALPLSDLVIEAKAHWGYSADVLAAWQSQLSVTAERILSSPVYVYAVGTTVAGFHALDTSAVAWKLEDLWVRPAWMRQGIGRSLLIHAIGLAASHGIAELTIDAEPNAEAFYLACGAHRVGSVPAPIAGDPDRRRPQLVIPTR